MVDIVLRKAVTTQLKQLRKEGIFFRPSFRNCLRGSFFYLIFHPQFKICVSYIYIYLFIHPSRVYYKLTI